MADPRLNSLHLDTTRRQEYRRAREVLLNARGNQTLCAEQGREEVPNASNTFIQNVGKEVPTDLDYWLVDREFIYPLKVGVNTVGRAPDNDVVVQDSYVSRRHCAILVHVGKGCELHDTASKNGTYLNGGKLTTPTFLQSGDEIRTCDRTFVFLARDAAAGPRQSPTLAE
jgi:hypothetical protein